jgi:hypothetical protein
MLQKPSRRAAAPTSADAADVPAFKSFAETLAKKLAGSAKARRSLSSGFLVAIYAWAQEVYYDKFIAALKTLQKTKDCIIALSQQLKEAQRELSNFGPGAKISCASERPPPTTRGSFTVLLSQIETVEASIREYERVMGIEPESGDKSRQGRPRGTSGYRHLETLVFLLELHSAFHGAFLTAYVKKNGELKVAAGSLINALNMLRCYLVNDYPWLANSLPRPDQHLMYVSTYQRILTGARIEARDRVAVNVKNPADTEY